MTEGLGGRAAAAAGDADRAASLLSSAADGFAGLEASWEAAVTKLDLADAQMQQRDDHEASATIQQAAVVFERLGSLREIDRAAHLLAKLA